MTKSVEKYLVDGCGRCSLTTTPDCKVLKWSLELDLLRAIILKSGLKEESKWGMPCYTLDGKNVLIMSAFKDFCSINFVKGALLTDPNKLLVKAGENTQSARLFKFTTIKKVITNQLDIETFLSEAIEIERKGLKVVLKKSPEPIPEELVSKMKNEPVFKAAFEALTPGRQRGYILHFSAPKQSKTRVARIEKSVDKILKGEGLNDNYKSKKK